MKRRSVAVLKWAGLTLIVLGVVYAALYIAASLSLRREYAALKAAGRPLKWDEMIPPRIPDTDNAALLYDAAVQLLQSEPPIALAGYSVPMAQVTEIARRIGLTGLLWQLGNVASKTIEVPPYPAATDQLRQLLQNPTVSEALAVLERGTAKQGYYHEIDYSRGSDHYRELDKRRFQFGALSIILCATARQQAAEGNREAAWHTAIANLRFANARKDDPEPIILIDRQIQARLAMSSIRAIASHDAPSDQEYKEIESLLKSFDDNAPLVRQQDAERLFLDDSVWTQSFLKLRSELQIGQQESKPLILLYELCPALGVRDHAIFLRIMRALAENAAKPVSPNDAVALQLKLMSDVPRYCIVTRNLLPADPVILKKLDRRTPYMTMVAAARVTQAGLAALRYRREKGTYPADLQAMNLNSLLDPFTGKPLIYRAAASGFTVYSIGENGIDDGGEKSEYREHGLGLIIPGIRKVEFDDVKPDIVWSHND